MARTTQVVLTDDLDGGEAAETVAYAVDGTHYEIDLSAENAEKLRSVLEEYAGSARKASGSGRRSTPTTRRTPTRRTSSEVDPAAVRAWAASNDITVSPRGRLARKLVEAFHAAGH